MIEEPWGTEVFVQMFKHPAKEDGLVHQVKRPACPCVPLPVQKPLVQVSVFWSVEQVCPSPGVVAVYHTNVSPWSL